MFLVAAINALYISLHLDHISSVTFCGCRHAELDQ